MDHIDANGENHQQAQQQQQVMESLPDHAWREVVRCQECWQQDQAGCRCDGQFTHVFLAKTERRREGNSFAYPRAQPLMHLPSVICKEIDEQQRPGQEERCLSLDAHPRKNKDETEVLDILIPLGIALIQLDIEHGTRACHQFSQMTAAAR